MRSFARDAHAVRIVVGLLTLTLEIHQINSQTRGNPDDELRGPIFLSEPPEHVIIPNTEGAVIPCTVYGNPAPLVTWVTEEGAEVEFDPNVVEVLHNNSLYFHKFSAGDVRASVHTHTYRCMAQNRIGRVISRKVHTKVVIVGQLEKFLVEVHDEHVMRGGTAVFQCETPLWSDYVKITGWTQGSQAIVQGGRFSMTSSGELHVRDVRDSDAYIEFRCTGTSDVTAKQKISEAAKLEIHDPPAGGQSPTIDAYPTVTETPVGAPLLLPCVATGWPLPTYRWYRNGSPLNVSESRYVQMGGDIFIQSTQAADGGEYLCNASNPRGYAVANRVLVVIEPLSISIEPGHQVQDSGKTAILNCSITGSPITSVMWYKDGNILEQDARLVFKSSTLLEIRGVSRHDQGMYQCFAIGTNRESQSAAQLLLGDAQPTIVDGYSDRSVQKEQRASVRCIASGNPTPEVTWTLDDQPLTGRGHVSVGSFVAPTGDVYSYVNISSVSLMEGGEYRCIAKNRIGTAYHVSRLNVYGEPYIREMANITATAHENLFIKCYVTGHPKPSISWWKDNRALPVNHFQTVIDNTLTIQKVQKIYDAGKYTCMTQNEAGMGMQRSVYVSVVEPPVIDPFRIPPRKQGDRLTLSCAVSSGDLPIYISWTKDFKPIPPHIGISVETSGSYSSLLKIDDVSPLHDGNYTCHAYNEAARTNFTALLHVDVPSSWIIKPEDTSVIRLNSVVIDCLVTGIPEPSVTWSEQKGNAYVQLDVTDRHYSVFPNGTLKIDTTVEEDEGNYLCKGDNSVGHPISQIIYLKVLVPARFDVSEKNYTVVRNNNITLDCQAIGDKPLSMSWNFRNRTMGTGKIDSRNTISVQNTTRGMLSQLTIHPAARGDTGVYTCTAANEVAGKQAHDSTTIYLTVLEPPDAPGNLTLVERGSRSVVLVWSRPFDGNSPIIEYIIEYQNNSAADRGTVLNTTVGGNALTATVVGLHPSFLYDLRIRARNAVGLGLTSHQVSTKLLEEAPNGPPTEVKVIALGSQKLQATWKPPALEQRNGVILGYYIRYQKTQNGTAQSISRYLVPGVDDPLGEVKVELINLEKFTEYKVCVRSFNREGQGPDSPQVTVKTLEDVPSQPPEDVQAYALSSQSISVSWSPPPFFSLHGVLQGYKVLYKPDRQNEDESDASFLAASGLDTVISDLDRYTNYSIQVLGYTRKGEGVRSSSIYVRTLEDVPGRPAGIKAFPVNSSSVMVSWRPPVRENGVLTSYSVYYCNTSTSAQVMEVEVPPEFMFFLLRDLDVGVDYWVRVAASTRMGEGDSTQIVTVTPVNNAPARITSFSREVVVSFQVNVLLPCNVVGDPTPTVTWSSRYGVIDNADRHSVQSNGSLLMVAVIGTDADNYTCRAVNQYGSDVITYSLSVQVDANSRTPPKAPILSLAPVTSSTIQVNWLSRSNGGSSIISYLLQYRKDHDSWREVVLGPRNRTFTSAGLLCGTGYKFSITALNGVGRSEPSNVIDTKTLGGPPIAPTQDELLRSVNATSVELDFRSWQRDVCGIHYFSIRYQIWGDTQWVQVNNNINWNTTVHVVEDLNPATRYSMKVTAYSDAGSTECQLVFGTLTFSGSVLEPLFVTHNDETLFYEKLYIMAPLSAAFVVLIVVGVGVALFCVRRRQVMRYKENSSNIRRDITAETSLMNDLDKRLNCVSGDSPGDPRLNRNVNLLISLHSDDNLSGHHSTWGFHDVSKTNSDNASLEQDDEDANINPYATFNDLKLVFNENPKYHKADPEYCEDSISLEKAEAQKAMMAHCDAKKPSRGARRPPGPPTTTAETHSYDNQAVMLSPRKYASAEQIHALFTMAPPRPQSAYSKNRSQGTRSTPSEKGSQRHSLISSVTTVSSSRDELMEAFENLTRNPPPPVVYETEADSLSQPTDSSSTEPGICLFTESPPQPNERREASCEVPRYESPESVHYTEQLPTIPKPEEYMDSRAVDPRAFDPRALDPRAFDPRSLDPRAVPRRAPRQHCAVQKMKDPLCPSRGTSRVNARPNCIEEVTYTFSEDDSPIRSRKPYSFDEKLRSVREERSASVWRKGGRRTPHARTRYDTMIQTPGAADDKPLVSAQVMAPQDETPEDEESVSLLERFYRPVAARRTVGVLELDEDSDYTENFTVV